MSGYIFGRRVRFALVVLASQVLLIALAVTWIAQMIVIALNGSVRFVEYNHAVLWLEIILSTLISLFGLIIFIIQLRRLGESRKNDDIERRSSRDKV